MLKKAVFAFFICAYKLCLIAGQEDDLLAEANTSYQQGEKATTFLERKKSFNRALSLYLNLANQYPRSNYSGQLNAAIADSYFQLNEYPQSILYNYRALTLDPHNPAIKAHLYLAQKKLELPRQVEIDPLHRLLSFNQALSLPQRFELFFWITLLTILIFSGTIWFSFHWLKRLAYLSLITFCLIALNLLASFYLAPIEGILISPSGLYRNPGWEQTQLVTSPLMEGTKVRVLASLQQGKWLKIKTDQATGYVPAFVIRII